MTHGFPATALTPPWPIPLSGHGPQRLRPRLTAAAASAAITAAVLGLFSIDRPWPAMTPAPGTELRAVLLTLPAPVPPERAAVPPSGRRPAVRPVQGDGAMVPSATAAPAAPTTPAWRAAEGAAITMPRPEASAGNEAKGAGFEGPAPAASAPLRLDRAVIREAARASRSPVARMADASGTALGDGPVGRDERLATEVSRTARPDCLPLSNPGGDLLLTPLMALAGKITGRCQ